MDDSLLKGKYNDYIGNFMVVLRCIIEKWIDNYQRIQRINNRHADMGGSMYGKSG